MSSASSESQSGHNVIMWAVAGLIGLNLILALVYSKKEASGTSHGPVASASGHGENATKAGGDGHAKPADAGGGAGAGGAAAEKPAAEAKPAAAAEPGKQSVTAGGDRLRGKVVLKGTPPPEKVLTPITADKNCGALHKTPPKTRGFVVGEGNGLANVLVYVKSGLAGKKFDAPADKVVVDQVGCLYEPYVTSAMAGQTLSIKNSDEFMHNVNFPVSKAGNPTFNFSQGSKGQVNDKAFPKPELWAKLVCNVHPWMACFVGIVDSPFHSVTDKDGNFTLPKGLPAGDYVIEAAHPRAGNIQVPVKVGADGGATLNLEMTVPGA